MNRTIIATIILLAAQAAYGQQALRPVPRESSSDPCGRQAYEHYSNVRHQSFLFRLGRGNDALRVDMTAVSQYRIEVEQGRTRSLVREEWSVRRPRSWPGRSDWFLW